MREQCRVERTSVPAPHLPPLRQRLWVCFDFFERTLELPQRPSVVLRLDVGDTDQIDVHENLLMSKSNFDFMNSHHLKLRVSERGPYVTINQPDAFKRYHESTQSATFFHARCFDKPPEALLIPP